MSEFIKVTINAESGVATVVLDRPKLNPLNRQMQNELREAFLALGSDESVRVIVMHGNERAFAAGADVKEMIDWSLEDVQREGAELQACFSAIASTPRPVIAAVNGYALGGGCELALCADLRIAGESAQFGQPEILLGIIPGAGGTQRLARLIGASRAKDLIFTGRAVKADAMQAAKRAVDAGLDTDIDGGIAIEERAFAGLFGTEDRVIGMRTFVESGPGKARFLHR